MFCMTGLAQGALPANTSVEMRSEIVAGAYLNYTFTSSNGVAYPNGTVVTPALNGHQYYENYTITNTNSTSFNMTYKTGIINVSRVSAGSLQLNWPSSPSKTIASLFPYTNDTNTSDYVALFKASFSLPKNVTASVAQTVYEYKGLRYAAITAMMSGYVQGTYGYPKYPNAYTAVFSPYSGILFSEILNVSFVQYSGLNGTAQTQNATYYVNTSYNLNSTNIAMGNPISASRIDYTPYALGTAAVVIVGAVVVFLRRNKRL